MRTFARLFCAFAAFCLTFNTLLASEASALPQPQPNALQRRFSGALCDLSQDNVSLSLPADINAHGGRPLVEPIADHPALVVLAVGIQNYTCQPNGTWLCVLPSFLLSSCGTDEQDAV